MKGQRASSLPLHVVAFLPKEYEMLYGKNYLHHELNTLNLYRCTGFTYGTHHDVYLYDVTFWTSLANQHCMNKLERAKEESKGRPIISMGQSSIVA